MNILSKESECAIRIIDDLINKIPHWEHLDDNEEDYFDGALDALIECRYLIKEYMKMENVFKWHNLNLVMPNHEIGQQILFFIPSDCLFVGYIYEKSIIVEDLFEIDIDERCIKYYDHNLSKNHSITMLKEFGDFKNIEWSYIPRV